MATDTELRSGYRTDIRRLVSARTEAAIVATLEQWVNASPERQRTFSQERLIVDVAEEIWSAMRVKKVSKADLAKKLGCSKSHVTQILNGRRNMTLRSLADICFHLDMEPSFLMRSAVRVDASHD